MRAARRCCSTSASATCRSSAARRRCRPASCSGCGWRRRCARTCSASSTCSTSRRPACTRPTPRRCCAALDRLKASGNSLFVVEHELDVIRHADWIVDVGPGGRRARRPDALQRPARRARAGRGVADARATCSATTPPAARTPRAPAGWLRLDGVTRNNLHELDVDFPLGVFTTVTGVSGSGKSSLVSQALVELVAEHLGHALAPEDEEGDELERAAAAATRRPDRRRAWRASSGWCASTRSRSAARRARTSPPTPGCSTTCASCSPRRKAARARRYDAGRFSFNVAKGRCETCEGEGFVMVELLFLPSVYAPCPTCHGARYNAKTLEITLPRQEHRRRAGHDGRRGVRVLRRRAARAPRRSTCCARSASATCASASRRPSCPAARRSASSSRPSCSARSAATRSTSSTSRRPACTRPTSRS